MKVPRQNFTPNTSSAVSVWVSKWNMPDRPVRGGAGASGRLP